MLTSQYPEIRVSFPYCDDVVKDAHDVEEGWNGDCGNMNLKYALSRSIFAVRLIDKQRKENSFGNWV